MDEEDHERTLQGLIDDYNDPNNYYELLDSIEYDEVLEDVDLDKNPAAQVRPIKHTHTLATSANSINLDPVITGVGMIGREGEDVSMAYDFWNMCPKTHVSMSYDFPPGNLLSDASPANSPRSLSSNHSNSIKI